jgi:CDP-paratose 2-epimerase
MWQSATWTRSSARCSATRAKQVRDNIHALDVARLIECFIHNPRCAEVYNIGGGKQNSCSVLEAIDLFESITGKKQRWTYFDDNRIGDHICYYSDLSRMLAHYPEWSISKSLDDIFNEIVDGWRARTA